MDVDEKPSSKIPSASKASESDANKAKRPKGKILQSQTKKRTLWKNAFDSPFALHWGVIGAEEKSQVIGALSSILKDMPGRHSKKHGTKPQEPPVVSEDIRRKFGDLVIGLNAVTRALEKDDLRLVICTRELVPSKAIQHLPVLCNLRSVPLCPLAMSTQDLASLLGASEIRTMICMGFRRNPNDSSWDPIVDLISTKCPAIDIPWIPSSLKDPKLKEESLLASKKKPESMKQQRRDLLALKVQKIQHTAPPKVQKHLQKEKAKAKAKVQAKD